MKDHEIHPLQLWFRSLPKWQQYVYGLPIIAACAWNLIDPPPPEPGVQKAGWIASIVVSILLFVAAELLRPKPNIEDARPAGLGDFKFPTATEGRVIPIIWGRVLAEGPNVVWYGDLFQEAITQYIKSGLFSGKRVTKGFRYKVGVQAAICRGPVDSFNRMLIGDREVVPSGTYTTSFSVDEPELFGGDDLGSGGFQATFDIFLGTTTQSPSTYLQQHTIVDEGQTDPTPRYTGTCYLVARELNASDLTQAEGAYVGNSTSIKPWKFELTRMPPAWTGQTSNHEFIGSDANPINVIYEILTNTEWGYGFPEADIDLTNFNDASLVVRSELLGFSMLLDSPLEGVDLIDELERHIDGILYLDHTSGKWQIKLARDDYDIDLVPQINTSNIKQVKNYTNGTWEETMNQIRVKYFDRADAYKETYATAIDSANYQQQGGGSIATGTNISGEVFYPGCKNATLANKFAWRELRSKSIPLARAKFVVTREFWNLTVGQVVAWTDSKYGANKVAMRISRIDFGRLDKGEIEIDCIQDIFSTQAPSFGDPGSSLWTDPENTPLVAYPAAEQLAFEAPRGILVRDPDYEGSELISKVMCAARRQGLEAAVYIGQRNASGTPTGSFAEAGLAVNFMRIGKLDANLNAGSNNASPIDITINPDPDTQSRLESLFDTSYTTAELGTNLNYLIMVNDEFMVVTSAVDNGADVDLENVYRGVLDSAQGNHSANDEVYLIFAGAALTDDSFDNTFNVDIRLQARSTFGNLSDAGLATIINLTMAKRALRPYPPAAVLYNSSGTPWGNPSLEGSGSVPNDYGVDVDWWRRNFQAEDEIAALLADDSTTDSSTEYQLEVRYDPDGANTLVGSISAWTTGAGTLNVTRNDIIVAGTLGSSPTVRFILRSRHDYLGETDIQSRNELIHDVTPTSALSADWYLGAPTANNPTPNAYTTAATGTFTVNIGAAMSSGIDYRINGGSWTALVGYTSGVSTSGTIPGVTSGQTIELRRTSNVTPNPNYVEIQNPSATRVAYGAFYN